MPLILNKLKRGLAHGLYRSPEYKTWSNMRSRCYNIIDRKYKYYGGRGVVVCEEWRNSFVYFFLEMGPRPSKRYSINRIDNKPLYSGKTCEWALKSAQIKDRSKTYVTIKHPQTS